MKKLLFTFAFALIGVFAFASNPVETANIEITTVSKGETTVLNLRFDSIEDFHSFDSNQLNISDEDCMTSISLTVSIGVGSTYASVTVTADNIPCNKVGSTIKKLKKDAKKALK